MPALGSYDIFPMAATTSLSKPRGAWALASYTAVCRCLHEGIPRGVLTQGQLGNPTILIAFIPPKTMFLELVAIFS
jgi:hypothetical protein